MGSEQQQPYAGYGMSHRGEAQLMLLWRDPEVGYVYWELIEEVRPREAWARLLRLGAGQESVELERWPVAEALSGRFVRVDESGARYRAELGHVGADGSFEVRLSSEVSDAPRRGPGSAEPRFVRVNLKGERGLGWEPIEHIYPKLGRFLPGSGERPSSAAFAKTTRRQTDDETKGGT